jgi:hypothetical protein
VSRIVLAGVDISFCFWAGEETTDLHALSGHVGEDTADEVLERRHDYVIKGNTFAQELGEQWCRTKG